MKKKKANNSSLQKWRNIGLLVHHILKHKRESWNLQIEM